MKVRQEGTEGLGSLEFWLCALPVPILLVTWLTSPWTSEMEWVGSVFWAAGLFTFISGSLSLILALYSAIARTTGWRVWTGLFILNAIAVVVLAVLIAPHID